MQMIPSGMLLLADHSLGVPGIFSGLTGKALLMPFNILLLLQASTWPCFLVPFSPTLPFWISCFPDTITDPVAFSQSSLFLAAPLPWTLLLPHVFECPVLWLPWHCAFTVLFSHQLLFLLFTPFMIFTVDPCFPIVVPTITLVEDCTAYRSFQVRLPKPEGDWRAGWGHQSLGIPLTQLGTSVCFCLPTGSFVTCILEICVVYLRIIVDRGE